MKNALLALTLCGLVALPVHASGLNVLQRADVVHTATNDEGLETLSLEPAELVQPGQMVRYTLSWTNDMETPAEDVVLEMPIPEHMQYVSASEVSEGITAVFSVDGGETYGAFDDLVIRTEDAERPADASDLTHVQWHFDIPMPAHGSGEVFIDTVLK